ncbi:LIM domain-containing protein PLIM2b [Heracleum sosnowskyi]|uniref:LIM domain-containing protein PLIM2b n=1 Tax=Heracleum sosnowskyi TaxID=360622 RepID=A0AAD8I2V1_9APIA|nr:LIM domain-containing protein PLIM2b [Heracleum sosnowskyi]
MAFTGTLDKCDACGKTVYFMDLLTADGITFHKSCFKCSHCKGTLVMSNYSSMDGTLYCKTHFDQLFKESGNFSKNFQPSRSRENSLTKSSSIAAQFSGTQDKCSVCNKTVYPLDKMTMEEQAIHKSCFKCAHGGCSLTHSSYASLDGVLYCKNHFSQLFMEKGTLSHVLQSAKIKSAVVPVESEEAKAEEPEPEVETEEAESETKEDQPETKEDQPEE